MTYGQTFGGVGYVRSIIERVSSNYRLQRLATALGTVGLTEMFDCQQAVTLFAPTDEAFDWMSAGRPRKKPNADSGPVALRRSALLRVQVP